MPEYKMTSLTITVKFNSTKEADKNTPAKGTAYPYTAEVTYTSVDDAVEKAGRFTVWALQRRARKGELPTGKLIKVNGEGEYAKSLEENIAEIEDTNTLERMMAAVQAKLDAKLAAAKAAEPVEKAPGKKGSGKN